MKVHLLASQPAGSHASVLALRRGSLQAVKKSLHQKEGKEERWEEEKGKKRGREEEGKKGGKPPGTLWTGGGGRLPMWNRG